MTVLGSPWNVLLWTHLRQRSWEHAQWHTALIEGPVTKDNCTTAWTFWLEAPAASFLHQHALRGRFFRAGLGGKQKGCKKWISPPWSRWNRTGISLWGECSLFGKSFLWLQSCSSCWRPGATWSCKHWGAGRTPGSQKTLQRFLMSISWCPALYLGHSEWSLTVAKYIYL